MIYIAPKSRGESGRMSLYEHIIRHKIELFTINKTQLFNCSKTMAIIVVVVHKFLEQ